MAGNRLMIQDSGGLSRNARAGDSLLSTQVPQIITADANDTISATKIAAGFLVYTGFTVARNLTTDTAANIAAAFPSMDIGDSIYLDIAVTVAFAGNYAAGAGVTLRGRTAVPASGHCHVCIVKTGAATFDWISG